MKVSACCCCQAQHVWALMPPGHIHSFLTHCFIPWPAVCTCSAATSALDQLRDKSHNFDLVLSDVYMPGEGKLRVDDQMCACL